jgi:hypothetical protein
MNHERNGKLLTGTGLAVLTGPGKWRKWPDGGVVTQRTANPRPRQQNRQSSHVSRSVPRAESQALRRAIANHPSQDTL